MKRFGTRWLHALLTIAVLFLVFSRDTSAQILVGENFPITAATQFQSAPAVAVNPASGEFLVVWHDLRPFGFPGFDIFGQRVAADGGLIGAGFPVRGGSNPAVVFNSSANEFFVIYDRGGIFGQRVRADGSLIGGEILIVAGLSVTSAAIAYNSSANEYLVVWSNGGVQGRIIDAASVPVTLVFDLSTGLAGAGNPAVVFNAATEQYFVVWDAFASPFFPGIAEISGRLVNGDGTFAGPFFAITTANGAQAFPAVTVNAVDNQYLVVWSDNRNVGGATSGDVFGQLVNADGSLAGENVPISTLPFNEGSPSVAHDPTANQYLVAWMGQRSGAPGNVDIYGRLFATNASPLGDAFQISTAGAAAFSPRLAVNPATGVFLTVWPDERNLAVSSTDIFGQLIALLPPVIQVDVDIRSGVNPRSKGMIAVAILTRDVFDATTVDPLSVAFGANGALEAHGRGHLEDVDGDGRLDLVLHFRTQETGIRCGDISASLTGKTFDGQAIEGVDFIHTVGCE